VRNGRGVASALHNCSEIMLSLHELSSALYRPDFSDRVVRRLDLARAKKQLRPDYRGLLFETQILDRPFREVAEDRGMTLSALKSMHHRALEQLRKIEAEAEAA
jgi:DNA-directed RNA polymerase specialized sigma24 family protein